MVYNLSFEDIIMISMWAKLEAYRRLDPLTTLPKL